MCAADDDAGIANIAALEGCIGKAPGPINLKVIDHLDDSALRWLTASPLFFAGFGGGRSIGVTLGGGVPGFVRGTRGELLIPLSALDNPMLVTPGSGFGSLFLVPSIGETLRINGRVTDIEQSTIRVAVEECYVHCAKALIRSDFWAPSPTPGSLPDLPSFIAGSRFMALATMNAEGQVDLSPKGDPANGLARLTDGVFSFAERPGNRRADSFRNMIAQPRVALAMLVPGSIYIAELTGTARLTAAEDVRAAFVVQGKTPLLVTNLDDLAIDLKESQALGRAGLWPAAPRPDDIDPAKMLVAHVQLNKSRGLQAKLVSAVLSVPGMMQKGLDKDYKTNLY